MKFAKGMIIFDAPTTAAADFGGIGDDADA